MTWTNDPTNDFNVSAGSGSGETPMRFRIRKQRTGETPCHYLMDANSLNSR
jgi:hypothetical protein